MQITSLQIKNFKAIRDMKIPEIENALILVGKNNTGKTSVLDAVRAVGGTYKIKDEDFHEGYPNIEIWVSIHITEDDLQMLHVNGIVSQYRRYEAWEKSFLEKLPSYKDGVLTFEFSANRSGKVRYGDGVTKNNVYIQEVLPRVYYIDAQREMGQFQKDLLMFQEDEELKRMRTGCCMFDQAKRCNQCFSCIGLIKKKTPEELSAFETAKLLDYKLYQTNLGEFTKKVNENFHKNGGLDQIIYSMNRDAERMLKVTAEIHNSRQNMTRPADYMGKGMRSIYMLSLLETYVNEDSRIPSMILVEDPEIFLHPKLQRVSGEILYRLSKKNQVIFTTHSPNLLSNFSSRQIRQTIQDEYFYSAVKEKTDISQILDDLGYTANDLMNVNFVFIVEGKQDKSRLPLLLQKYYSEVYDENGELSRVAIVTTNSCTNIKTYANLKYMNQIYLRDQFLMIRDGDGKDSEELKRQLCKYYEDRNKEDIDKLPKVMDRNVLILKYYSFENYFLNPKIMARLGIVKSEEEFYQTFFLKWKEYLYRIKSGKQLQKVIGKDFQTIDDVKCHMEEIKTYLRGHNLYDIFYGKYKKKEKEILGRYIDLADRAEFEDILDSIDCFIYFESRRKWGAGNKIV